MKNPEITRHYFLSLKYPLLPYCEVFKSPPSEWAESIHITNLCTEKQLNFHWYRDETVSVALFDGKEKNKIKTHRKLLDCSKEFNQKIVNNFCELYLK